MPHRGAVVALGFATEAFLLFDGAAGDAIARIAGRIGHQVVGFSMDHNSGAAFMEERVGAFAQRGAFGDELLPLHPCGPLTPTRYMTPGPFPHAGVLLLAGRSRRRSAVSAGLASRCGCPLAFDEHASEDLA